MDGDGRGWLAIALAFFGGWRPQYIAASALFSALVMTFAFRWARVPEFLGRNYDRESRTA